MEQISAMGVGEFVVVVGYFGYYLFGNLRKITSAAGIFGQNRGASRNNAIQDRHLQNSLQTTTKDTFKVYLCHGNINWEQKSDTIRMLLKQSWISNADNSIACI